MEGKFLTSLGKIAGIGGIALGVFFLLFKRVLERQYLPQAGLNGSQAFHVIIAVLVFTFGIAAIGILAWIMARGVSGQVPNRTILILVTFAVIVLYIAAKTGSADDSKDSPPNPTPTATPMPTSTPSPTPVRKYFSEKLAVHERDSEASHGVNINSTFIGLGSQGAWVELVVTSGNFRTGDRYPQGSVINIHRSDCESLTLTVKDIKLEKPPNISWERLRKMGPEAEAYVKRTATLLLSGKCEE